VAVRRSNHPSRNPHASRVATAARLILLCGLSVVPRPGAAWQFTAAQAQNVDLRGHVGGSCREVSVAGNRLLIGQGPRLTLVDATTPTRPIQRASLLLPTTVKDIAQSGSTACVLADGLWLMDTAGGTSLRELSRMNLSGEKLVTTGTLVYVLGAPPNIQVVDIRYPTSPLLIGLLDLPHGFGDIVEATGLVTLGRYAFVSYTRRFISQGNLLVGGVMLLDISDPKTPGVLGDFRQNSSVYEVALDGHTLYQVMNQRIIVYDVSDPLAPRTVGEVAGPTFPSEVSLASGRAYVAGSQSAVWAFGLAGASLPRALFRATTRGEAFAIAATAKHLFVADGWTGLRVFDVATTGSMVEIGGLDVLSEAQDIVVADNFAYVADARSGVRVFSLFNRDRPVEVARIATAAPAIGVALNGRHAYVVEDAAGIEVFDVGKSTRPRLASLATTGSVRGVSFLSNYALVASGPDGLLIVNIADPAHPVLYGRSTVPSFAEAVVASINRAFVCDRSGLPGVWEINVSSPAFPTVSNRVASEGGAVNVALQGDRLCVAEADQGLRVVDVSRPGFPRTTAQVATAGSFQGLAYEGNVAYVADSGFGLRVFNLLDPYNPSEVGFLTTPGFPRRVAVAYGRMYLAAGDAGLYVLGFHWAPDLTITGFDSTTQDVAAGTEVHVRGKVVNLSTTATATAFSVGLYVSRNRSFSEPRQRLCPLLRVEAGLTPANPVDLAGHQFVVLAGISNGVFRLGIVVDPDSEVDEFREDNNVAWLDRPFYIGPRPSPAQSWALYK